MLHKNQGATNSRMFFSRLPRDNVLNPRSKFDLLNVIIPGGGNLEALNIRVFVEICNETIQSCQSRMKQQKSYITARNNPGH